MEAKLNINLSCFKVVSIIVFIITLFSFGFSGCRKYPDDPAFSKISLQKPAKKILGKWKIKQALVNGVDRTGETEFLKINYYRFYKTVWGTDLKVDLLEVSTDNSLVNNNPYILTEKYTWDDNYKSIFISSYTSYLSFTSIVPKFSPYCQCDEYGERWFILKLTKSDLWLEYAYNGNSYETRFERID